MIEQMEENRARDEARAKLNSIKKMILRIEHIEECKSTDGYCNMEDVDLLDGLDEYDNGQDQEEMFNRYHNETEALNAIDESPLGIQLRSGWHNVGEEPTDDEFEILLCTGGPAVKIRGELDSHGRPDRAWLEYQDWGIQWTFYTDFNNGDMDDVLKFAQHLIF
jgi:hypothetical protein